MFRQDARPGRSLVGSVNRRRFLQALVSACYRLPDGDTGTDTRPAIVNLVAAALGWQRRAVDTYLGRYVEIGGGKLYDRLVQVQPTGKPAYMLGPASMRAPVMLEFGLLEPLHATRDADDDPPDEEAHDTG